ncbi:protein NOI4-like isoform X1 [Phragmites australis]|uniref:protein NOI4-like isoform X1 n=1 Tax=Phragmites australis TaxID=29695 RepID=UPI002D7A18C3|nr:protein NOI4-like isoform X1 [Phragmites australis]
MAAEKGSPLPKFGEWDVNDPASAEGFTVIFNKARDEKKTGGNSQGQDVPTKPSQPSGQGLYAAKGNSSKKWFCCLQPTAAESRRS